MTFSPGTYHLLVKKQAKANVEQRVKMLRACLNNPLARASMIAACRQDLLLWVNLFVWQVDPKRPGVLGMPGPFVTYEFQDRALLKMLGWVERGKDGLLEKSRQMGASWMMLMLFVWLWLFHDWQTFLFISRNEMAVEDKTPNSLFWKIDFLLKHLPDWMTPRQFRRNKKFFGNDDRNSFIFGEASTGKANVGGNTTAMGVDEFSQIDEDYEVLHRTSDATRCRIFNGTHLGLDTAFYELTKRVDMEKLVLHWSEHPVYSAGLYRSSHNKPVILDHNYAFPEGYPFVLDGTPTGGPHPGLRSPWYDDQCRRKGSPRAVAMDLDINPSGSVAQFFDAVVIRRLQEAHCLPAFWEGHLECDPDLARPRRLRAHPGGPFRLWLHLSDGVPPPGTYFVAADLSSGQGKTPSVMSVVTERGEKVGEYVTYDVEPTPLAATAVALCWLFKGPGGEGARLAWEVPGPGLAFGTRVVGLGYRNIYYRERLELLTPLPTDIPGWASNTVSKRQLLEEYRDALQSGKFLNRSWEALQECLAFRYTSAGLVEHSGEAARDSPADARLNHGDRVIADALAWRLAGKRALPREKEAQRSWHPATLEGRRRLAEEAKKGKEVWS